MVVSRPGIKPASIFSGCKFHHAEQQHGETPDAAQRADLAQVRAQSGVPVKTQAE